MTEDAMRATYQQFTATLEGLARQNVELQNELAQSRQQAANELAALRQEVRGAPLWNADDGSRCGHAFAGEAKRLLRGARRVARQEHRRLQKLMDDAAKSTEPTPNATIVDDEDRTASAQLFWMMLMICKGAALNTVFLAGDSEGLEAWRQLTEKYEPKMRTRFAGQLMSIL